MKDQNMPKADFVTSLILLVFGISIIIVSVRMPRLEELGVNPYSVPGIVPGFLGVIITFLSVILFLRSILQKGYQLGITLAKILAFFQDPSVIRVLLTLIISVIYGIGLLGRIPYILATFLYVIVFVTIFEYRRDTRLKEQKKTYIFSFIQAILVAGIVAAVFRYVFLVDLP